ncbi:MAG: hypothetical protein RL148_1868 [Planctomycetota bacterium]
MSMQALGFLTLAGVLCCALPCQGPVGGFDLLLADGGRATAATLRSAGEGQLELAGDRGSRRVRLDDVVALRGGAVVAVDLPESHLAGGEVVRGALVGGDEQGDWLEVLSPSLGRVRIATDRLTALLLRPGLARVEDLRLAKGVAESLFTRAGIGLDAVAGTVHRFGEQGVQFQPEGEGSARWFGGRELVGLRIGDAQQRERPASHELVTRAGDRVGIRVLGWNEDAMQFEWEDGRQGSIRASDVASLCRLQGVTWLSSLVPDAVDERGYDGEVVLPWARDRAVHGGMLVSGGRTSARGIGVHSRSRIRWVVPAAAASFATEVGIDDSVLGLGPRAHVQVRVLLDGEEVFAKDLRAGDAPVAIGPFAVKPGQVLGLEVDFGKGRDLADRVDWLLPVFLQAR